MFQGGLGIYSFPGGNVTFDGVSLGSTATYTTNEGYLVNGRQTFTSIDVEMITGYFHHKGLFQVMSCDPKRSINHCSIFSVCLQNDLLSCNNPTTTADTMLCCNRNSLCSTYTGLSNGSIATYTTSQDYCILSDSLVERTCGANMLWNGETPTETTGKEILLSL